MKRYLVALLTSLVALTGLSNVAAAGELTNVIDAFDDTDPYDGNLEIYFDFYSKSAKINKERVYNDTIELTKELKYEESLYRLMFLTRFGLFKDVELYLKFPIVIKMQSEYKFQDDVSQQNSQVDPANSSNYIFHVPFTGPERKGFGDMKIGLRYQPYNEDRDPEEASWVIGVEFTLPTGTVRKGGLNNTGVGEGMFDMMFFTAISRRVVFFMEPYFGIFGGLRFPAGDTLFKNYGETQTLLQPGANLALKTGIEFIPWEVIPNEQRISVDLGFGISFLFEGRQYSELFEGLASSACNGDASCFLTTYSRGLDQDSDCADVPTEVTDGITDYENYGTFQGWAGINIQPIKYVQLKFYYTFSYDQAHFITNADPGKDLSGANAVEKCSAPTTAKPDPINEFNPVYNENYDRLGTRFKVDNSLTHAFLFMLAGKF